MVAPRRPWVSEQLVGRDREVRVLGGLVEAAAGGAGGVLLISGEAGAGKSRLVDELVALATARRFAVLVGHGYPEDQAVPLAALAEALGTADAGAAGAGSAGHGVPTLGLSRAIEAEARRRPHCLVLEDAHWSDEASLEVIGRLARRAPQLPLLVAITYRPDAAESALGSLLEAIDRGRLATELRLAGLRALETAELVRQVLGMARPPGRPMAEALHALTDGNPFFIEETLRALVESGRVDPASDVWDAAVLDQLRPPRAVHHAVQRQLERVTADARRLLTVASVLGRRFDLDVVAEVMGRPAGALLPLLREAIDAQLVTEAPDGELGFRHALTREAVYSDLLVRERQQLHLEVARTLEAAAADDRASAGTLAHHYYLAREWTAALDWSTRAATAAHAMSAPRAAATLLTQALHASEQLGRPPSASMHLQRAEARDTVGDFEGARQDYERAFELAREDEALEPQVEALLSLGMLWCSRDYGEAERRYVEALGLARGADDAVLLARALNHLGNWHVNAGDPAAGLLHHQEALALAEAAGDARTVAETLDMMTMGFALAADYAGSAAHAERALEAATSLGDGHLLASLTATLCSFAGGPEMRAIWVPPGLEWGTAEGERALAMARELEWGAGEAYALGALAGAHLAHGEYGSALECAHAARELAEALGHLQWEIAALVVLGAVEAATCEWSAAREHLEQARSMAEGLHSRMWDALARAYLGLVLAVSGEAERGTALLDEAEGDLAERTGDGRLAMLARGELALRQGEAAAARALAERLIETSTTGPGGVIPAVWRLLGEALTALGEGAEAEARLRAARETARGHGWRPEVWLATCALARLFLTTGDARAAEEQAEAVRLLELIAGSLPEGETRQRFLEQAAAREGLPRRASGDTRPGRLTAREREVLSLVVEGLSNAEVAARLVIDRRTVESHVAHIFRKADVTSRPQAIRWALDHGIGQQTSDATPRTR